MHWAVLKVSRDYLLQYLNIIIIQAPDSPSNDQIIFSGQCVKDHLLNRVLSDAFSFDEPIMTFETCRDYCDGYNYFGLENANECFCGNEYRLPLELVDQTECNMECPTCPDCLSLVPCGGFLRIQIWSQEDHHSFLGLSDDDPTPATWTGQCRTDNRATPILNGGMTVIATNSVEACKAECTGKGFKYYGVELGTKCFCGTEVGDSQIGFGCTTPCPGNPNEACGGGTEENPVINVYEN